MPPVVDGGSDFGATWSPGKSEGSHQITMATTREKNIAVLPVPVVRYTKISSSVDCTLPNSIYYMPV